MNTYTWWSDIGEEEDAEIITARSIKSAAHKAAWIEYGLYSEGECVEDVINIKDEVGNVIRYSFSFTVEINLSMNKE